MEFIDAKEITTYFKNIVNEWGDGYKDINLEELSESDKKVVSALAYFMLRTVTMIHEFPTIDAEPVRHAHWEDCSNGWMCSICNRDSSKDTEYCPHCGAKMDGE